MTQSRPLVWVSLTPFHGENRGSIPLGRANASQTPDLLGPSTVLSSGRVASVREHLLELAAQRLNIERFDDEGFGAIVGAG